MTYPLADNDSAGRKVYRHPSGEAPHLQERRMVDRRKAADPNYTGPERRKADRRVSVEQQPSRWPWLLVAGAALMTYDAFFLGAEYRKHLVYELNDLASGTRAWSANVWKTG